VAIDPSLKLNGNCGSDRGPSIAPQAEQHEKQVARKLGGLADTTDAGAASTEPPWPAAERAPKTGSRASGTDDETSGGILCTPRNARVVLKAFLRSRMVRGFRRQAPRPPRGAGRHHTTGGKLVGKTAAPCRRRCGAQSFCRTTGKLPQSSSQASVGPPRSAVIGDDKA